MKFVKYGQVERFSNSDKCKGIEYPLNDKDINLSIAQINGRYPDSGYCINEVCKELVYVLDGNVTLYKKDRKFDFNKGDAILIDKGEIYYWDGKCQIAMICTPAWYTEQHKVVEKIYKGIIIEESLIDNKCLDGIEVIKTQITKERKWTLKTVNITKEKIQYLSSKIKSNSYYMHFWNDKDVIVVFRDKIFEIDYDNKQTWNDAIEYGISIGIPREQLNFPID